VQTSLALWLVGCAATSPSSRLEEANLDAPARWTELPTAKKSVDAQWIERFKDATLEKLIEEALENNRDLRMAQERVTQAAQNARIVGSQRRPTAQLGFPLSRSKRNFIGFPGTGGGGPPGQSGAESAEPTVSSSLENSFGPSLDVSWELDVWGRIRAAETAAMTDAEAVQADYAAARASLVAQVAKAYFALAEAEEQTALGQQQLETARETERAIGDRFRSGQAEGEIIGAQFRLAKSDTASAQAQLAALEQERDRTRRSLEILLGRYPANRLASPRLPSPPSRPPAGLPSELLLRRPDVLAAERRFAAQGQRVKEARRALYPQFKLTGSVGTSTSELEEILNSDFGVWTLAANVVQPLLTGGRLRAEINQRQSAEREAVSSLQKTVLQAFSEVENALADDRQLLAREKSLTEAAELASEADQEARAAYRGGVGDILTVLSTQNRRLTTQSQLLTVRRARLDSRINLHLALGGDYSPKDAPKAFGPNKSEEKKAQ
jgi:outer membrane protein, multidrug efflux system